MSARKLKWTKKEIETGIKILKEKCPKCKKNWRLMDGMYFCGCKSEVMYE